MNKQTNKTGPFEFDSGMDFAPDEFKFDDPIGDSREPAKPIRDGVKQAFKSHITSEDTLRRYVSKALPPQYETIFNTAAKGKNVIEEAYSEVTSATKKPINDFAKLLASRIPEKHVRSRKLVNWLKEATDEFEFDKKSQAKIDSDETQAALSGLDNKLQEILAAQGQLNEESREREEDRDNMKRAEDYLLFNNQNKILNSIQRDMQIMQRYTTSIDLEHKKKVLEAQYRTAFGIRDLNSKLNELTEITRAHLKAIQQNTGLPEEQKLTLYERGKGNLKNKFINKTIGRFTDGSNNFMDNFLDRVQQNVVNTGRDAAEMIRQGTFMTDMVTDNQDDFSGMSQQDQARKRYAQMLASLGLSAVGPNALGGVAQKVRSKSPKLEKFLQKWGSKGGYAIGNSQSLLRNFAYNESPDDGVMKKMMRAFVGMGLGSTDQDDHLDVASGNRLGDAHHSDQQMRRAQVEVVPGLLSMMLREMQYSRTGKDPGLMHFDYKRGGFKTTMQAKMDILGTLKRNSFMQSNMDTLTKDITEGMSDDDKKALQKHLLYKRRSGATMTDKSLMKEDFFDFTDDPEKRKEYAKRFAKFMDSEDGKFSDTEKANERREWFFSNLNQASNYASDNRAALQAAANEGQTPLLRQMGLIDEDNKITKDAMYLWDLMQDPDVTDKKDPRLMGRSQSSSAQLEALMAAQRQQLSGGAQQQQQPQMQQRQRAAVQNLTFKGYEKRGVPTATFMPATNKHIDTNANGDLCVCKDKFDVLGEVLKQINEAHGQTLAEIRDNTSRLGVYYVQNAQMEAGQAGDQAGVGFWNKTLAEHAKGMGTRGLKMAGNVKRGLGATLRGAKNFVTGDNAFTGWFRSLKASGARYIGDMVDGIPRLGDLYVAGQKGVVITKAMLREGKLRDAQGKVIQTLKDVSEAIGDIYDDAGNVVMTQADRASSYLRGDGIQFAKRWASIVARKGKDLLGRGIEMAKDAFGLSQRAGARLRNFASQAVVFAAEVVAPTKDVYVRGETTPRLYASLIRKGWYSDQRTGKTIYSETQIAGPLVDPDGNIALSSEDITKGLVDVEGNPLRNLREMAADFIRSNVKNSIKRVRSAASTIKNAAMGVGKRITGAVFGAGRAINKFLRFGASGFGSESAVQQAAQAASEDQNTANAMTVSLLTQIRDILANVYGMPYGQGVAAAAQQAAGAVGKVTGTLGAKIQAWKAGRASSGSQSAPSTDAADTTGSGQSYTQSSALSGPSDFFSKMAGGGIASAAKFGKGLWNRFKRRRGRGLGSGGADTGDGVSREDLKTAIDESRKEGEKISIKERLKGLKDRATQAVSKRLGRGPKEEGEEAPEGSVAALRKKFSNSFRNFRDERDHNFQDYGVKNSVDVMMDTVNAAKDKISGWASDAADFLPDGDERRKKGGRRGRGKAASRAARKKAAQTASRQAAKTAANSVAKKAASSAATSAATAGAGALARRSGVKALAGWGLKRIALAAGGGLLAALGSPLAAAALTGIGVVWTAKSIYDWFMSNPRDIDKPKPGDPNKILNTIRMVEYGVGLDTPQLMERVMAFEAMVFPAVKGEVGSMTIDTSKIDADRALSLFGISKESGEAVDGFLVWLESRFKPTFLKWMDFAKVSKLKLGELDKLEDEKRMKILEETERTPTGWDVNKSPFNGGLLEILEDQVKANIANAKDLLQRNMQNKANTKDPKDIYNPEKNLKAIQPMMQEAKDKRTAEYQSKLMGLRENGSADQANQQAQSASSFSSFKSAKHQKAAYGTVDELTSIRMRAYGFGMLTPANLASTEALEQYAYKFMSFENGGVGNFNGDVNALLEEAARVFGFSLKDEKQRSNANTWLLKRFIPVFVEFAASVRANIGKMDLHEGLQALTPAARLSVATAILSHDEIWSVTELPTYGIIGSSDATSVKPYMERLEALAREKTLTEMNKAPAPKIDPTGVNRSDQTMRNQPEMRKANYTPSPTPPTSPVQKAFSSNDAESEPRGSGGAETTKAAPPSAGLAIADGKLYSGNNADQYLQLRKGAKLDGVNPEVKKLFLGMVEEFGTHTGLNVGVNSGFRSYEEQAREYRANPGKAAKPGGSLHESGLAIDIDSATADKMEKLGLMRKYGFTRPVGGEPWHIEPAGIQGAISQAKANPDSFAKAIADSAGKGGGGVGMTRTGFPMGKRDSNAALSYQTASARSVSNDNERKTPAGAVPLPSSGTGSSGGGYGGSIMNAGSSEAGSGAYASLPSGGGKEGAKKLVTEAAKIVGLDPDSALVKVNMESGFKTGAKADGSSGQGLWQMTKGAWSDTMRKHGAKYGIPPNATPMDDRANALLGAQYVRDNLGIAEKKGLPTDLMSAYLMHFFGPGGGPKFMGLADGQMVAEAMPDMAAVPGNKNVFYDKSGRARTKAEMLEYFKARMDSAATSMGIQLPGGSATTTPASQGGGAVSPADPPKAPARSQTPQLAGPMTAPEPMQTASRMPTASPQETSFQNLSKDILAGQEIAGKQLTALEGILGVLNNIHGLMQGNAAAAQSSAAPPVAAVPSPLATPGINRREVSKPLV